jgi:SAM-dependent methyltransferase
MESGTENLYIEKITDGLKLINGIWYPQNTSAISYPEKGNDGCFKFEDKSYWFKIRNKILSVVIKKYSKGTHFFDIGGGNGFVTSEISNAGFKVFLIEPGEVGILNAKSRGVKNLINSSFQEARFKENSLENIGLFDVLEHVEDDLGFIKSLSKCIKADGKLFITVPAYNFLWSKSDIIAGHHRRYSIKKLSSLLNQCGFTVFYRTYFFSFLLPIIFLFRSIPFLFCRVRKHEYKVAEKDYVLSYEPFNFVINQIAKIELTLIKNGNGISFGSSCLIVAKKNEFYPIQ